MKHPMFGKKKQDGEKMDPIEKESKMTAIKAMKKMAEDEMSGKLGSLKKITVASDSPAGLEKGLSKAKDLVEAAEPSDIEAALADSVESDEESEEVEVADSEEAGEYDQMSAEDLDCKLEELMKLKEKMKLSKA